MLGTEAQASGGVRLVGQHCGEEADMAGIREGVERMPELRFQGLADLNSVSPRGWVLECGPCRCTESGVFSVGSAARMASCSEEGLAAEWRARRGHVGKGLLALGFRSLNFVLKAEASFECSFFVYLGLACLFF